MTTDAAWGVQPVSPARKRWPRALVGTAVVVAATVAPSALAQAGAPQLAKSKAMVKVVKVAGFGEILETRQGRPLYVDAVPPCDSSCLGIWPPLLMPGSKNTPLGTTCLGTTAFSSKLQVTYNGQPLYTFVSDMSHRPPTGNGVMYFEVVTVPAPGC